MCAVLEDDGIWCWMSVGMPMDGSLSIGPLDGCMHSPRKIGGKYDCLLLHGCEIGIEIRKGGITACGGSPLEMYGKWGWWWLGRIHIEIIEILCHQLFLPLCFPCINSSSVAFHRVTSRTDNVPFTGTISSKSSWCCPSSSFQCCWCRRM
jgi:hypothetical protein